MRPHVDAAQLQAAVTLAACAAACLGLGLLLALPLRRHPLLPALLAGCVACALDGAFAGPNLLRLCGYTLAALALATFRAWRWLRRGAEAWAEAAR